VVFIVVMIFTKLILFIASYIVASSIFAFSDETIFYEDFEGANFPPTGWTANDTESYSPGYNSDTCARIEAWAEFVAHGGYYICNPGWIETPDIILEPSSHYTFTFFHRSSIGAGVTSYELTLTIDYEPGEPVEFDVPDIGTWSAFNYDIYTIPSFESLRLKFYICASGDDEWGWGDSHLYIDEVSLFGPPVGIETTSLGRIKAIYR